MIRVNVRVNDHVVVQFRVLRPSDSVAAVATQPRLVSCPWVFFVSIRPPSEQADGDGRTDLNGEILSRGELIKVVSREEEREGRHVRLVGVAIQWARRARWLAIQFWTICIQGRMDHFQSLAAFRRTRGLLNCHPDADVGRYLERLS